MTWLVPILVRRLKVAPWLAEALAWAIVLALIVVAIWWLRADAYRDGARDTDARWAAASARMQAAAVRAANAADVLAQNRQTQLETEVKDLRHEAAKGTADPVGHGVSAVLERLRAQAGR